MELSTFDLETIEELVKGRIHDLNMKLAMFFYYGPDNGPPALAAQRPHPSAEQGATWHIERITLTSLAARIRLEIDQRYAQAIVETQPETYVLRALKELENHGMHSLPARDRSQRQLD